MSDPAKAVFLSYAREDAEPARRIADALRSHGVEVWFDQSELRGGDAWDAKIRKQIDACTLFVPIISKNTQERGKGYFRLEWKLAVEQTHLMAEGMAFLAPVVIDETSESGALVPPEFMRVQWTRLPGALPTPQFVEQVKRLVSAPSESGSSGSREAFVPGAERAEMLARSSAGRGIPGWTWGALVAVVVAIAVGVSFSRKPEPVAPAKVVAETTPPAAAPAPGEVTAKVPTPADKSIAVLPFANLSTDKENEFFADGVHDDVITNLAKIRDLKVISRTSVLAYRDPASRNLKKIAAELGVATILEGSIRRVGSKVHMNAQLIDARTDEHLWADTFDGDTGDIFALQANLARQIAGALKATLTPGEQSLIERRPTKDQMAYEIYLQAKAQEDSLTARSGYAKYQSTADLYHKAIELDPAFAIAYTRLALVESTIYWFGSMDPTPERKARAVAAMQTAVQLAPEAPETHMARGAIAYFCDNDWERALVEYKLAERDLPNDARLQGLIGYTHRRLGHWGESVAHLERTVALNPRDFYDTTQLAAFLIDLRRFEEARDLARRLAEQVPSDVYPRDVVARAQFALDGDRAAYLRAVVALPPSEDDAGGFLVAYRRAMLAGDLIEAGRVIADPRFAGMNDGGNVQVIPASLLRAQVAFLRHRPEEARRFADEAIAWYGRQKSQPRQQPFIMCGVARAKCYAGRVTEAVPELEAAVALELKLDAYGASGLINDAGRCYAALGLTDKAFASLRQMMTGPTTGISPNEIRIDPFWSQLKDDPRFEEILKSAKPL